MLQGCDWFQLKEKTIKCPCYKKQFLHSAFTFRVNSNSVIKKINYECIEKIIFKYFCLSQFLCRLHVITINI